MNTTLFETLGSMTPEARMSLIAKRRSIRRYQPEPIDPQHLLVLNEVIDRCNRLGHLTMTLRLDDPEPFNHWLAHYGNLRGVRHYVALVGQPSDDLEERIGYYGELLVLQATALGLGTCWIAGTYNKSKSRVNLNASETLVGVIAIGIPAHPGVQRRTKSVAQLSRYPKPMPPWFGEGMKAVQMAPTAMNQQKFRFETDGTTVKAHAGIGFYTALDLGIAKLHFEIGSDRSVFGYPLLSFPPHPGMEAI